MAQLSVNYVACYATLAAEQGLLLMGIGRRHWSLVAYSADGMLAPLSSTCESDVQGQRYCGT